MRNAIEHGRCHARIKNLLHEFAPRRALAGRLVTALPVAPQSERPPPTAAPSRPRSGAEIFAEIVCTCRPGVVSCMKDDADGKPILRHARSVENRRRGEKANSFQFCDSENLRSLASDEPAGDAQQPSVIMSLFSRQTENENTGKKLSDVVRKLQEVSDVFVCTRNCYHEVPLVPLPVGSPPPACPVCGNEMVLWPRE